MSKVIKAGMMPGRINEVVVANGTSIEEVLQIADLDPTGYEVKVDGVTIQDASSAFVDDSTNLVLLVKQVKGNANGVVRVGMMPGRIQEHAVEVGTPVAQLLQQADLDPTGYTVKIDGNDADPSTATVTSETDLILLVKQVKGNN